MINEHRTIQSGVSRFHCSLWVSSSLLDRWRMELKLDDMNLWWMKSVKTWTFDWSVELEQEKCKTDDDGGVEATTSSKWTQSNLKLINFKLPHRFLNQFDFEKIATVFFEQLSVISRKFKFISLPRRQTLKRMG